MLRGKVTNVTSAGVFVQTADFGTLGPCQYVGPAPAAADMVLLSNVGSDVEPDLVVVGKLGGTYSGTLITSGSIVAGNGAVSSQYISVDAPKGTANADIVFRAGGSNRWTWRRSADTEAGSNAGSNLTLVRRSDTGSQLSLPIIVWRSTGKVTFGDVGTTAGIELGSSGPTITTGTGAPSHSAPNGSVYLRTDGTATTTLYVRAGGAWTALS